MDEESINDRTKVIGEILSTKFEEIENRALGNTCDSGIPVSFYDYDAMTQGLPRGGLIVLGGRPAMGKTSLSLNMALNVAKTQNLPICLFHLEISKEQISNRLLSMEIGIESGRLRTGRLELDEWSLLSEGIDSLSKLPLHINDKPISSIQEMQSICQKIKEESTKKSLGLVILDYVQLLDYLPISDVSNREEYLLKLAKSLKRMAEELNVPVIVISQLSKDVEKRRNKRPMLSDIRDFEPLEVYSDIITMIYRDEYYNPETEDRGIAEIITCKHRNGPLGTVKLLFEPQFTRYRNLAA